MSRHITPQNLVKTQDFNLVCLSEAELSRNHFPSTTQLNNYSGYITLPQVTANPLPMVSLMCEFCQTTRGLEIIRVIAVNQEFRVVINEFVRPSGSIIDPMTDIHGVEPWRFEQSPVTLVDIQNELCALCDQTTIIVGHGLDCDLTGLKLVHFRCADTKVLYCMPGKEKSLPMLGELILKRPVINPIDYPITTMELCWLYFMGQLKLQQPMPPPATSFQHQSTHQHQRMNITMMDSGSSSTSSRSSLSLPPVAQRSFGEKQELIARVHERLINVYRTRLVRPVGNCLRGQDTIRIHCKKWEQLVHIENMLGQIERVRPFHQICLPISMKTKSQKKGFFVYLKFYNTNDVRQVLNLIGKSSLYKAEIAGRYISSRKRRRQSMF